MTPVRHRIIDLIEHGYVPTEKVDAALKAANVRPNHEAWLNFIDRLLLWLGALSLAVAAVFFIAYNWNEIGRFAKFGMIELALAAAVVGYVRLGDSEVKRNVALLTAAILLGVLLALFGQTYQTGADPWQLFFGWAMLMLPWALISRFPAIWILWIALLNIAAVAYHQTFRGALWFVFDSQLGSLWAVFIINTLALIVWESLSGQSRWAPRLLAVGSGFAITWLSMFAIFDSDRDALTILIWTLWIAGLYALYRHLRRDLFMLAGGCLSAIFVIVSYFSNALLRAFDAGVLLFLGLLVIALGAGTAMWLRRVQLAWQS